MGTKCAPSYANLFMGHFEFSNIYPLIQDKSIKYLRYIDDIFLLWTGTEQQLKQFIEQINNLHHSIKFTVQYSFKEITFLDTTVYIKNSRLHTKTYKKPTDRSSYLHNQSYHPSALKKNIPYGQALRLKKICTEQDEFDKSLTQMNHAFLKRGYQQDHLTEQFKRASSKNRDELLQYKNKTNNRKIIPLITTYNKKLPNLKQMIEKHWNILKIDENLATTFNQTKPVVAYRRNKNLKDLIGQTNIKNNKVNRTTLKPKTGKCRPCLTNTKNLCCKQVLNTNTFTSHQTKQQFQIFHNINCRSNFIIYLLHCTLCKTQYVGKSETAFNVRLNNHRKDARNPRDDTIPACKHFHGNNHDFNKHARFTIIEQIKDFTKSYEDKRALLLRRENFWITKLKTLTPHGLNMELN